MAFIQYPSTTPVFPVIATLGWSIYKKPILSSRVIIAATGREAQVACAVYPRWSFILSYGWLRDQTQNSTTDPTLSGFTEFEQISGLFLACKGSYGEFYYDDPDDDSRSNMNVAIGNGTTTTFPLYYSWGNGPFTPSYFAPVQGINTIDAVYFNNVLQSPSLYTVDSTNTQIVFFTAPASGVIVTASFHFYFRCRFLDDDLKFSMVVQNRWQLKELRFESVKP